MSDPTDNALAAIASILDQTTTPPETAKSSDKSADKAPEPAKAPQVSVSIAMPPPLPSSVEVVTVETVSVETVTVTTTSVEAAPAEPTAVEQPEPQEPEPALQSESSEPAPSEPEPESQSQPQPEPLQPQQPIEANGYSKSGPGPMAALRFRWTVREDDGRYYVDETVGEGSTPLVNGPMDSAAAIRFVDDREAEARRRFEHFKHEIVSRTAAALQASRDRNEV